jgi:hypothetical protein
LSWRADPAPLQKITHREFHGLEFAYELSEAASPTLLEVELLLLGLVSITVTEVVPWALTPGGGSSAL